MSILYVQNPETPGKDFFSVENYVNIYNPTILSEFFQLARQSHWHLYLVQAEKREVVNVFEFENCMRKRGFLYFKSILPSI